MAGAPEGNKNAVRGYEATRALQKALDEESTGTTGEYIARFSALVDIWRTQINKAKEGDVSAAAMIVDRLEGRPKQALDIGGQDDNPVKVQEVTRTIVDPKET